MTNITNTPRRFHPPLIYALLAAAALPLHGQTLIRYTLNSSDNTSVAKGIVPNAGTLGNGTTNGSSPIALSLSIPTNGVPPGAGDVSIYCDGGGGVLSPGTRQLNNSAIASAGGFTYEAWFNWNGSGTYNAIIDYAGTQKLVRYSSANGPEMEYYNTNNSGVLLTNLGSVPANQWHYAAVVFTATHLDSKTNVTGNFTFYLDTNRPTGFVSGAIISPYGDSLNRTIGVGTHPLGSSSDFFNGSIYEPRVTLGALPSAGLLFNGLVVTNAGDTGPGTLRALVAGAPGGAGITFAPALNGQTITLSSGQITIATNLTIDASGLSNGLIISGNGSARIFQVNTNVNVTLNSLTISNGSSLTEPNKGVGGGLLNFGGLMLNHCTVQNNQAGQGDGFGGGIITYNGALAITNCTFFSNSALDLAGAICVYSGTCSAANCTFAGNTAGSVGGALYNQGTFIGNNCTISGNTAGTEGGGIENDGSIFLTNTVVAGNTAPSSANAFDIFNTANNLTSGDPRLSPLGFYGGPTMTMPPLAGSPAIDAGTDEVTNFLATDQRGGPRFLGLHVDIGAVELNYAAASNANDNGAGSLRAAVASGPAVVGFASSLSGQTIKLTSGEILLGTNLTIDGSELAGGVTLSGNTNSRIFEVGSGAAVLLDALTLANGSESSGSGGGIFVDSGATLTVTNCTLTNNSASYGGGIENQGNLYINNSTFSGNSSGGNGGAIDDVVENSLISAANSTFSGNTAFYGGAIYNEGVYVPVILNNCTISGNSAPGFGIGEGGGIYLWAAAYLYMTNTILAGNTSPTGANLYNVGTLFGGPDNLINGSPLLAPLANYGGPTATMPPLFGSPAIGAGLASSLTADQRGDPRPSSGAVDIGAVQTQAAPGNNPPALTNLTRTTSGGVGGAANTFQFTFTGAAGADFSVLTTTNVAAPLADWTALGEAIAIAPGQYQFIDTAATNAPQRFYQVVSP